MMKSSVFVVIFAVGLVSLGVLNYFVNIGELLVDTFGSPINGAERLEFSILRGNVYREGEYTCSELIVTNKLRRTAAPIRSVSGFDGDAKELWFFEMDKSEILRNYPPKSTIKSVIKIKDLKTPNFYLKFEAGDEEIEMKFTVPTRDQSQPVPTQGTEKASSPAP